MMKKWGLVIFLLFYFPFIYKSGAQSISNEGTDFWAVFPTHDPSGQPDDLNANLRLAKLKIYVTSKGNSRVTVTCGGVAQTKDITANQVQDFDVQRDLAYIKDEERNRTLQARGIHIEVAPGMTKVAVYAHIYAGLRSAASLILPVESLGQEYYSMNYTQNENGLYTNRNFLTLVAVEPNTKLKIHLKGNQTPVNVTLANAGDVYEYMPSDLSDLTGTFVEIDKDSPENCNKRFAAFSGCTSVAINCDAGNSRDPLFQQLYPTSSWGKEYGVAPFKNRKYYLRVIAEQNETTVRVNNQSYPLNKGEWFETDIDFPLTAPAFVSANNKISLAQYSLSQECSSATNSIQIGDPEMVLINPFEFNIKSITLFSSSQEAITQKYINVVMKTAATSTFRINGVAPTGATWTPLQFDIEYSTIQLQINSINSTLTANDGFNAIAYGFGDHESYAYSAGTNLAANNYLLISNEVTKINSQNACIGQESDFKIVLPYIAQKIVWQLDDGSEEEGPLDYTVINGANGETLYQYKYGRPTVFPEIATHRMVVRADRPNENNCLGSTIEYNFTFDVNPLPGASFGLQDFACADMEISFRDQSTSGVAGRAINKWLWDFGDGNTSTEQSPRHTYASTGKFLVHLSAGLDDGCMSDAAPKEVYIRARLSAKFAVNPTGCVNNELAFVNQSFVTQNDDLLHTETIMKWHWDFGDNQTSEAQSPVHTYAAPGTYIVKLVVESENGCSSNTFETTVTINKLPVPDFSMPKVCLEDDNAAFTNLSTDGEGSTNGLIYQWDFGDADAAPANNSATQKDGSHRYTMAKLYQVTLKVTDVNGCSASITKDFVVNGPVLNASFEVMDKDNLCSNRKVYFKNTSTVGFGKLTRVEWYVDRVNKPTVVSVDDDPLPEEPFEFQYPEFTTAADQQFTVTMIAYSGSVCFKEHTEVITVHASPKLSFDQIPDVCLNEGNTMVTQARETLGVSGSGKYTGNGIAADGTFDPQLAGVGVHQLTYTYTSASACEEVITQNITVNPIPTVSIASDISLFEGGEIDIKATATGLGLSYKWSPSTGLNRDDILEPTFSGVDDVTYTLTITSIQECSISTSVVVHVLKNVKPPNVFSPNGDGINDTWAIEHIETYPKATIDIFNRSGETVFSSHGYSIPFDGNYKNEPLPVGTYYYIIDPKNGRKKTTGALTIIR